MTIAVRMSVFYNPLKTRKKSYLSIKKFNKSDANMYFYKRLDFRRKILMNTTTLTGLYMKYKHFREIDPINSYKTP